MSYGNGPSSVTSPVAIDRISCIKPHKKIFKDLFSIDSIVINGFLYPSK